MSGQTWENAGTGGASLDATLGSSASADSNDPLFLAHPGDNGGNYVYLPGIFPNSMTVPREAALEITGDIDLRAYIRPSSWSTTQILISIFDNNTAADRAFELAILTGKKLQFIYRTAASTTTITRQSDVHTVADGDPKWVRVTLDVDNGSSQNVTRFYLSDDGDVWTQLGTDIVNSGVTDINIPASTDELLTFGRRSTGASSPFLGNYYRAQVFSGIAGTKVLDIDTSVITNGNQTTLTALTGQTVTIARGTAANEPRTTVVVAPVWSFGADDYFEIADNALLDFGATDSFTLVAVTREHAGYGTNDVYIAKKADTTNTTQGYLLANGATSGNVPQAQIGDGTNGLTINSSTTVGNNTLRVHSFVRNAQTDTARLYLDKVQVGSATDTTTGSLANSEAFRIGRLSGAGTEYNAMELFAVAVFNRALTQPEIDSIVDYYQDKIPS